MGARGPRFIVNSAYLLRADIQKIIRYCLASKLGWQLSAASSFEQGLALADAEKYSVVLMSETLLNKEESVRGSQLLSLKSATNIPIILLTNRVRLVDKRLFESLGIAAVISQPFDPLYLCEQVAAMSNQKLFSSEV